MSEDKAKKLAAEVRSATESTSFDLAGYGPQGCEAIVSGGLSAPLPLKACGRLPNEYAAITLHPITSTQPPHSCHLEVITSKSSPPIKSSPPSHHLQLSHHLQVITSN